jgi:DHA1 family bicyclomycin/chloramphenicol resistance-like MFS transporter
MEQASVASLSRRKLVTLLAAISLLGPFATDTYLPSLFDISRNFGVSDIVTQQTLTAYIIPFALMTLSRGFFGCARARRYSGA